MRNRVAQIAQRFGILLMLIMLVTSLIGRVPTTHAESSAGRAIDSSSSNLWPVDRGLSPGKDLFAPSQPFFDFGLL